MSTDRQAGDAWQKSEVRELVEMGIEVSPEASFINGFHAATQTLVVDDEAGLKVDETLLGIEGLTLVPTGAMDAFMREREWQLNGRLPEQARLDDANRDWKYRTDVPEGDARKLVTLVQDRMKWIGVRAWHHSGRYWMNNGEPETARVIAWQDLPKPATGHWQNGKLFDEERSKYAAQEAQRERIATVREYQARLDELYHDVGGVCRTPSEKRAFREMFPDSEL